MFYEKEDFKALKKKTSRDCMICIGKCSGHKDIDEKEPISILISDLGVFLERAKGQDAIIQINQIQDYKQTSSTLQLKTTDPSAKRLTLYIHSQLSRNKGCKILNKYMIQGDNAL